MKNRAVDALMKCGIPCNILGFCYISHAMELFDNGWKDVKTTGVYEKIAKDFKTTGPRVERALRHAFQSYIYESKGNPFIEKYFDLNNQKNGAQLACFYYRLCRERELEELANER